MPSVTPYLIESNQENDLALCQTQIYTVIPELRIVTISELANLDNIANSGTPDL